MSEKTEHPRIWQAITGNAWAIQPDALEQIMIIAERCGNAEALAAKRAEPMRGTRTAGIRNGVAIIPVAGPLFPRANMFTNISGATSTETLAQDIQQALGDPQTQSIVLDIDSPGGQVGGISELSDLIYQARGRIPITAFISGMGASAAYWIASAADEIVVSDTALAGSIGVVMAADVSKNPNRVEIVSSRAPLKRADLSSDDGRNNIQKIVNRLEDVFIASVARNRSVNIEDVAADFGQGGLLVGADAVAAGMADRVSTFESVIAGLSGRLSRSVSMSTQTKAAEQPAVTVERIKADHPEIADALIKEGALTAKGQIDSAVEAASKAERERIQAVYGQGQKLPGHGALIQKLMFDGKTTGPEAAVEILAAESNARGRTLSDIRADAPKPADTVDATQEGDAARIDPNLPVEERAKAEWDKSPDVRDEFGGQFDSYLAWRRADEGGRVHVLNAKRA